MNEQGMCTNLHKSIFFNLQFSKTESLTNTRLLTFPGVSPCCRPPGYSDPYCMLGILVGQSPREVEEKKERKFSFRKRKEKLEKRSSTKEVLPARCIQVTEVKPETLNPVWDEHFVL